MRTVTLPDVPYGATAVRPDWLDLPPAVRAAIGRRLGAPVAAAATAGGGFTRAFAATLTTAGGQRAFVKAAPLGDPNAAFYAREAAITAALPPGVPAPRPLWTAETDGYFVLCLEHVDGHVPALPWPPAELDAAMAAWRRAAQTLATGLPGLPRMADIAREEMSWWSRIAAGRESLPGAPPDVAELAALERRLPELVDGPGMLHGDLRVDNVLIDRTGAAVLCDWTWPCLGASWFDAVTLLVSAYASGLDADAYLDAWDAPPDGVDAALAALAGYWLTRAAGGPSSASPHSRQHQRFSGTQCLAWLADRRGWSTPD